MTNEERIKAMSTEELARFIDSCGCGCCLFLTNGMCDSGCEVDCIEGTKEWLKQEAEG